MLDFLMNDKEYFVRSNNQLSVILSQFDSDYVMDVIEDTLARSLNSFDLFGPPNAVESYEEVFKEMMVTYPDEVERINESRMEVYRTIIDTICKHMDLQFNEASDVDLYTMARCMYDFFVSRLNNYIVTFYERYIPLRRIVSIPTSTWKICGRIRIWVLHIAELLLVKEIQSLLLLLICRK